MTRQADCDCDNCRGGDLPVNPFIAPRVTHGMLLGEDDFRVLIGYPRGKHLLHQAWLHGTGVVWGYPVCGTGLWELEVGPGLAVDPMGRDLIHEACERLDLREVRDRAVADGLLEETSSKDADCRTGTGVGLCGGGVRRLPELSGAHAGRPVRRDPEPRRLLPGAGASPDRHPSRSLPGPDGCPDPRTSGALPPGHGCCSVSTPSGTTTRPARRRSRPGSACWPRRTRLGRWSASWPRWPAGTRSTCSPETEPGEHHLGLFPTADEDPAVVLAEVLIKLRDRDGCWEFDGPAQVRECVRSTLLPTDLITALTCGLAPGLLDPAATESAEGPRVDGRGHRAQRGRQEDDHSGDRRPGARHRPRQCRGHHPDRRQG